MSFGDRFKHAFKDLGHNIANGVKDTFKAVGDGLQGVGHMISSAARLDFKGIAAGASELVGAATDIVKNVVLMSPVGMAANTLLDDKLEKLLDKVDDVVDNAAKAVVNGVASSVESVKNGVVSTVHGLATGDFKEVLSGVAGVAMGGISLLPTQIAFNAAATVVGSVVSEVIPGKVGNVLGTVASSVVGIKNVAEGALTAGVAALGSSGALNGLQSVIPDQLAPVAMVAGNALMVGSMMPGGKPSRPAAHHAAPDLPTGAAPGHIPPPAPHRPETQSGGPAPHFVPGGTTGGTPLRPNKIELANSSRPEAAELVRQNLTADQISDLKLDVRDYFNHGSDVKRQAMESKWGDRIAGDFNDADLYKKLLFAVKDVG